MGCDQTMKSLFTVGCVVLLVFTFTLLLKQRRGGSMLIMSSDHSLLRKRSGEGAISPFVDAPKVVLLAGPHKTGSTSVQSCMANWDLTNWVWATPSKESLKEAHLNSTKLENRKRFAPLLGVLRHSDKFNLHTNGEEDGVAAPNRDEVVEVYHEAISSAWQNGANIIFGGEAMDYVTLKDGIGTEVLQGILDVLPWDDKIRVLDMANVEAVVTHRSPRVDHLLSVWHQQGHVNESLSTYLTGERIEQSLLVANSLGTALQFLERGVPTTIIDLAGVYDTTYHENFGLCQTVACDVLRVECDEHHHVPTAPENFDKHTNIKSGRGVMDLSDDQLSAIDGIMNRYDCSLRASLLEYMRDEKQLLRVLYQDELFRHCYPELDNYDGVSFSWMVNEIQGKAWGQQG